MPDTLIGKKLGDYHIRELLGRGGMARVYLGYDERLDRRAAVKVINNDINPKDRAEYFKRFQNEARSIAKLEHPNVVGVYQFGEFEDVYYMAMAFVEGRDLKQILREMNDRREMMPLAEIISIIRQIGSALDYAHKNGVIHRDVKPSNIMINKENRAILTDFGLALSASEGTLGETFGSAHYIAPEQAVSSAKAVSQSDLYSLGVCAYEMLTGKVPFDDPSAMSVALKHLQDAPPPLSAYNPNISPAFENVIAKILDKDPARRYKNGLEFSQALQIAYQNSPQRPRPGPSTSQMKPPSTVTATPVAPQSPLSPPKPSISFSPIAPDKPADPLPSVNAPQAPPKWPQNNRPSRPSQSSMTPPAQTPPAVQPVPGSSGMKPINSSGLGQPQTPPASKTPITPPFVTPPSTPTPPPKSVSKPVPPPPTPGSHATLAPTPAHKSTQSMSAVKTQPAAESNKAEADKKERNPLLLIVAGIGIVALLLIGGIVLSTINTINSGNVQATPTDSPRTAVASASELPSGVAAVTPTVTPAATLTLRNDTIPAPLTTITSTATVTEQGGSVPPSPTGATPNPSPTLNEPTSPTLIPSIATVTPGGGKVDFILIWDSNQLVMLSKREPYLAIKGIRFEQKNPITSETRTFGASTWLSQMSVDRLPFGQCYQVSKALIVPNVPKDCGKSVAFWVSPRVDFWLPINNSANATFEVYMDQKLIKSCPINVGSCQISLSPPANE